MARPPDFIGVGAQRCGTTWWHSLICAHPGVRENPTKELHFFDRFGQQPLSNDDVRRYHANFSASHEEVTGEWTPRYAYDFWTPALLARSAPDARLLFMVRDPVERYRSGLALQALQGSDMSALERAHFSSDAAHRGRYAEQLRRLRASFPSDRILVLQYEHCRENPIAELERTYRFLELDDQQVDIDVSIPRGSPSGNAKRPLPDGVRAALIAYLEDDVHELAEIAPEVNVAAWPDFSS
jgi:hypothetical protein